MMMMMIGNHRPEISSVRISSFVIKQVLGGRERERDETREAKVTLLHPGWMDGWMDGRTDGRLDGRMDMAAICQTTRRQRASEGEREGGRKGEAMVVATWQWQAVQQSTRWPRPRPTSSQGISHRGGPYRRSRRTDREGCGGGGGDDGWGN